MCGISLVLRTLADHQAFTLTAFCRPCDRSVLLNQQALADRWGWDVQLQDIRRRLRCQACGRRPERLLASFAVIPAVHRPSSESRMTRGAGSSMIRSFFSCLALVSKYSS